MDYQGQAYGNRWRGQLWEIRNFSPWPGEGTQNTGLLVARGGQSLHRKPPENVRWNLLSLALVSAHCKLVEFLKWQPVVAAVDEIAASGYLEVPCVSI
jgi:hypothetical protein